MLRPALFCFSVSHVRLTAQTVDDTMRFWSEYCGNNEKKYLLQSLCYHPGKKKKRKWTAFTRGQLCLRSWLAVSTVVPSGRLDCKILVCLLSRHVLPIVGCKFSLIYRLHHCVQQWVSCPSMALHRWRHMLHSCRASQGGPHLHHS